MPKLRIAAALASVCIVATGGLFLYPAAVTVPDVPYGAQFDGARALDARYAKWALNYTEAGGQDRITLALGYSKGLSSEYSKAKGQFHLNLQNGAVDVQVGGLPDGQAYDVWAIDNRPGPGRSVQPEDGDRMIRLGRLHEAAGDRRLDGSLAAAKNSGFQIDLVAVVPEDQHPSNAGLLFGAPSLFQRVYYQNLQWSVAGLGDASVGRSTGQSIESYALMVPRSAYANTHDDAFAHLVAKGEKVFFNETFDGNGRTCGTCHRAENNLTIDPEFIATLPNDDALFVAEFDPNLAVNFENPVLMREFGLILENTNGFGDLANNFTMRGVPHTLALPTSVDGPGGAPRLGWSG